jgi:hypothetical protein
VRWPHFHRWSAWTSEFEECPDGWMGVYEIRTRECTRKHCDMIEELSRCVSSTPAVIRLNYHYREAT